jgi:hypothetical protein
MPCKLKRNFNYLQVSFSSDACVILTYGDVKKIRDGIEELEFKP